MSQPFLEIKGVRKAFGQNVVLDGIGLNAVQRAGIEAKMPFPIHPHMLRHATGYALANKGIDTRTLQSYLGHRSIQSTVRYTELAPGRFKNIWR